jgi:hypothetical protein
MIPAGFVADLRAQSLCQNEHPPIEIKNAGGADPHQAPDRQCVERWRLNTIQILRFKIQNNFAPRAEELS